MSYIDFDTIFFDHFDNSYEIILRNEVIGMKAAVYVCPAHTIRQIVERYHDMIDLPQNQVPLCLEHLNTMLEQGLINRVVSNGGVSSGKCGLFDHDVDSTLEELGITEGCILRLNWMQRVLP
jgi:hypothetical protein